MVETLRPAPSVVSHLSTCLCKDVPGRALASLQDGPVGTTSVRTGTHLFIVVHRRPQKGR